MFHKRFEYFVQIYIPKKKERKIKTAVPVLGSGEGRPSAWV